MITCLLLLLLYATGCSRDGGWADKESAYKMMQDINRAKNREQAVEPTETGEASYHTYQEERQQILEQKPIKPSTP